MKTALNGGAVFILKNFQENGLGNKNRVIYLCRLYLIRYNYPGGDTCE